MADAFVFRGQRPVVGGGGAPQPALVDAAALAAERVIIVGMEFYAASRDAETAGDPVGRQTENPVSGGEKVTDLAHDTLLCGLFSPDILSRSEIPQDRSVEYGTSFPAKITPEDRIPRRGSPGS